MKVTRIAMRLLLALVLVLSLLPVTPAAAITWRTLFVAEGGTGDCLTLATACGLQTALDMAVNTDRIQVAAGTYKPTSLTNPTDPRSATFMMKLGVMVGGSGSGSILSGDIGVLGDDSDNAYHVVSILSGGYLSNFTITKGHADGTPGSLDSYGGGILIRNGVSDLGHLGLTDNYAVYGGGMSLDFLDFYNSPYFQYLTFSGNSAQWGGGFHLNGNNSSSYVEFNRVAFLNNTAVNGGGGAYVEGGWMATGYCTFSGNSAANGAGMYVEGPAGSATVWDSTFSDHTASGAGGGIYLTNSASRLDRVTFSNNTAASGGGLYVQSGSPESATAHLYQQQRRQRWRHHLGSGSPPLTNITFDTNTASAAGGGLYNNSGSPALTNVAFRANTATAQGGGMHSQGGNPLLTNVTFGKNTAASGGGLNVAGGSPVLANAILWGNSAPTGPRLNGSVNASYSLVQGWADDATNHVYGSAAHDPRFISDTDLRLQVWSGAIDAGNNAAVPTDVDDLDFNHNSTEPLPRDLDSIPRFHEDIGIVPNPLSSPWPVDMGAYEFQGTTTVSSGIVFVDQNATGSNGGTSWTNAYRHLETAIQNAGPSGGQTVEIWVAKGTYKPTTGTDQAATFTLSDHVAIYGGFAGNEGSRDARDWTANVTTLSGDLDNTHTASGGDAYHVVTAPASASSASVLDGFTISYGNASGSSTSNGGGMLNSGSPALAHLTFTANAANAGGGLSVQSGSPALSQVNFSANTATGGGGMLVLSGSPTLDNVTFSGNHAEIDGGGLHVPSMDASSSVSLTNVAFSGNTAGGWAGGLSLSNPSASASLTNVTFSGNTAQSGAGMYLFNWASAALSQVTFNANTASFSGGGLEAYQASNVTLTDVTFSGNQVTAADPNSYGGGLALYDSDAATLTNVTFSGNSAPGCSGGGLYLVARPEVSVRLTNVAFGGNSAAVGGALRVDGGNPTLTNVSIGANTASSQGGGIYVIPDYAAPVLTNAILWGNVAPTGAQINRTVTATYSIVQGWADDATNHVYGSAAWDPDFVSGTNLRLTSTSPAIDAGNNAAVPAGVTTDRDGNTRIVNATVDLGAYEYAAPVNVAPAVTTQPTDQTVATGGTATFTAAATGSPTPTVRWQVLTPTSGGAWVDVPGATSTTLTLTDVTVAMNGYRYLAVFTNAAGHTFSGAATLTVTPPNAAPTVAAGMDRTEVEGATFMRLVTITDPDSSSLDGDGELGRRLGDRASGRG